MSEKSGIEWTDASWNPVHGCTKVSEGCRNCYAETMAERFRGVSGHPFEHGFDLRLVPEKLSEPLNWRKPRAIFVNSMSDLFHKDIPSDYIREVCNVMLTANWHTYQVLTKRPERMAEMLRGELSSASMAPHIWWGTSVENKRSLPRINLLRNAPRKIDLSWIRSIRKQCRQQKIPFFFKQWGGRNKKKNGRILDGKTYDEMPKRLSLPILPERAVIRSFIDYTNQKAEEFNAGN